MSFFNRVFWRPRVADEVDEELAFHMELRTQELVARGMDPAAASGPSRSAPRSASRRRWPPAGRYPVSSSA